MTVAAMPYQIVYKPETGIRFYGGNREAFYSKAHEVILSGGAETGNGRGQTGALRGKPAFDGTPGGF